MNLRNFELKRKNKKEKKLEAKYVVVYAADTEAEQIDLKLRHMVFNKFDTLLHYSHINGTTDKQEEALIFDRLQNAHVKCGILKDANMIEIAEIKRVEMTLKIIIFS